MTNQDNFEQQTEDTMSIQPTEQPAPAPAGERIEEAESVFAHYADKFNDLVWYARKHPQEDAEYWGDVAPDIRKRAFSAMEKIEQKYPDEVAKLNGELPKKMKTNLPEEVREAAYQMLFSTDWEHGFNSGCLAAFRFALTALDREHQWEDELGDWCPTGGIEDAIAFFPDLDT